MSKHNSYKYCRCYKKGDITQAEAMRRLSDLSEYISENEYYSVRLFIEQWRREE